VYLPHHFTVTDAAWIGAFVEAAATATLVTFDGAKPVATLLPVIWDRPAAPAGDTGAASTWGRLVGHIAVANDQWQTAAPGAEGLAIVTGPDAYVSTSWYESKARHGRVVPTWNYEAVHLTGPVAFHRDPQWLRGVVTRLTQRHEAGREHPWAVSDAPPEYIDGQLRAIVGVELMVRSVEAKRKLSQNRSEPDRAGVVAGLRGEAGGGQAAIADLMAAQLDGDRE
jgi:transcriptional regulator